jgi:hypothetical protein
MACKQVEVGDHDGTIVLSGKNNTFLYQAYLGRFQVSSNNTLKVFIDDSAMKVGSQTTLSGDVVRTWYDGISYANVDNVVSVSENKNLPTRFSLEQNYPNPFNPSTNISYQLSVNSFVNLKVYDVMGREVTTIVNEFQNEGRHNVILYGQRTTDNGQLTSGVYFYRLKAGNEYTDTKKMLLVR